MVPVELGCLAVLAACAYAWRARLRDPVFRRDLAAVALAAWIAEDSALRLYGFHEYHAPWSVFVDRVPLLVTLLRSVVVLSAREVALALDEGNRGRSVAGAATIVLADAALLEPIAVHAGLWRWTAEGPFGVPLVGMLGWSFFAWGAVLALLTPRPWIAVWLAPAITHLLLLAAWWGVLRWIPTPSAAFAAFVAVVVAAMLTASIVRRAPRPIGGDALLARFAAACFFGALLASGAPPPLPLAVWTAAFVPPWLALGWKGTSRSCGGGSNAQAHR